MSGIGFIGGSFNPVHLAHIKVAESALKNCKLEKIVFIPTYTSPFKLEHNTSHVHRISMLKLAISNYPDFELSEIEIKRRKISYTYLTAYELSKKYLEDIFFILGSDSFQTFFKWKKYKNILKYTNLIVYPRFGYNFNNIITAGEFSNIFKKRCSTEKIDSYSFFNKQLIYIRDEPIKISSTMIRNNPLKSKELIDSKVDQYIKNNGIYSK